MTPQDTILGVKVHLRGDRLDPSYVTATLRVEPTTHQKKGDKIVSSSAREGIRRTGMWSLASISTSKNLSDHIEELRRGLGPNIINLSALDGVDDARLDIFFAADPDRSEVASVEFVFTTSELNFILSWGLSLHITTSFGSE